MPCSVRCTSPSRRPHPFAPSGPPKRTPKFAAVLDLSVPGERWVERFLRWSVSGPQPLWKPLAIVRLHDALLVAVEWHAWPHEEPFGLLRIPFTGRSLHWKSFPLSEKAQLLAQVSGGESAAELALSFGEILRYHREQARLSRAEVASSAKLSYGTIRNLETGRTVPSRLTLRALCQISALHLSDSVATAATHLVAT